MSETVPLGVFRSEARESSFSTRCHALAKAPYNYGKVFIASLVGNQTAVKSVTAALHNSRAVTFTASQCGELTTRAGEIYVQSDNAFGYDVKRARLGFDSWHVLAISRDPRLIPVYTPGAVMDQLMSQRFTTPILRGWAPYLLSELKREGLLTMLPSFGCKAALLDLEQEQLDAMVSRGIAGGQLVISREYAH